LQLTLVGGGGGGVQEVDYLGRSPANQVGQRQQLAHGEFIPAGCGSSQETVLRGRQQEMLLLLEKQLTKEWPQSFIKVSKGAADFDFLTFPTATRYIANTAAGCSKLMPLLLLLLLLLLHDQCISCRFTAIDLDTVSQSPCMSVLAGPSGTAIIVDCVLDDAIRTPSPCSLVPGGLHLLVCLRQALFPIVIT
jgi:hypothetical protein